jgi:hypothetical protein
VVPITTSIEGSKVCLEYHILHYPGLTIILVGVPLRTLLKGTDNGESLKMAVGQQILSMSFACGVNHAAEDEQEEDVLQQVMQSTFEEQLSPTCLDDVANYYSPVEEEVKFQDMEQEINPETPLVKLKQLPPRLQHVFLNGDRETLVIISDMPSYEET